MPEPAAPAGTASGNWRCREALDDAESSYLAPYAERAAQSRGRRHHAEPHAYRTAFQVDRDRIMYTTAYRRLQYKTQVFVYHEGDYYRSRLTHTTEAAQIARTVARALGANEDLAEAVTLAHDLGHPPFGHTGERTLDRLMLARAGLDPLLPANAGHGFNHTLQSLRIVELLERRWPEHAGLNLTWETREGIVKHATPYDEVPTVWAAEYLPDLRPSLEAQIVNCADELAYCAHDLDDGLRSGLLHIDMPELEALEIWRAAASGVHEDDVEMRRHRVVRGITELLTSDLVYESARRIRRAGPRTPDDVRRQPGALVDLSDAMRASQRELALFLHDRLYRHRRVARMFRHAETVLEELFGAFERDVRLLPDQPRAAVRAAQPDGATGGRLSPKALRAIADYLAGMTDRYAVQEHRRLVASRVGS